MRLHKYLAACGVASRRQAERLIEAGRVHVNGRAAEVGDSVDPAVDRVTVGGEAVCLQDKVYIVLNKPKGVVTSAQDTHGRPTVLDCVSGARGRVFPVGRLDMDVEGTLLLTNDGELAHRIMHPSYEVKKVYLAWVEGTVTGEEAARLERGVELDDGPSAPAEVQVVTTGPRTTLLRLALHEGRKREVKRLCAAVGHPVVNLRRLSVGGIEPEGLRSGEWRYLNDEEVVRLRKLTGLS